MKKRTIMTLVISIISILGASTLVYNALTPNAENYLADPNGSVSSETTTSVTSELTASETQMIQTDLSTIIDSPTNKNAPPETTVPNTTANPGATQTAPPPAAKQAPQVQVPATQAPAAQAPAAQAPAAQAPAAKGNAPDFTIYDSNDNPVRLSDYLGKPVVINFWASWCPPCKAEMPDFQNMSNKYSGQGVVFLMINMTDGSRETKQSATAYLNSQGFNFRPLFDTKQSASRAYSISSIPATFFITKDGNISGKNVGQISASALENGIKKIM